MTKPIDTETTVDTEIWYSVEYRHKFDGEDDWYVFDSSINSDTLEAIKLRLQGRLGDWKRRDPVEFAMYKFRIVRKELTTVALADEVEVEVGEGTEVEP